MTKLRNALTCALLAAGIFALAGIGILTFQLRESLIGITGQAQKTMASAQAAADQATSAIASAHQGAKTALADLKKEYADLKPKMQTALSQLKSAATQEQAEQKKYWTSLEAKTGLLLDSGKTALDELAKAEQRIGQDFGGTMGHVNSAVGRLGPAIDDLGQLTRSANGAIESLDIPAINASLKNTETTTENISLASADIREAVHRLTRPLGFWKSAFKSVVGLAPAARAMVP